MAQVGGHDVADIERWFLRRGVPHFIERRTDGGRTGAVLDTWTRALPLLVPAYLLLGLNALDLDASLKRNLVIAAIVVVVLLATWAVSNRLRRQPAFARPTDIGLPEMVLFLGGPAIPSLLFGQYRDAAETTAYGLVLLVLIYLWSSYGIGSLLRWTWNRGRSQLTGLGSLVARALPLLLLFNMFLFINGEVWEVAGNLEGLAFWLVVAIFLLLGVAFTMSRIPGVIRSMNAFESWTEIGALTGGTPAADVHFSGACDPNEPLGLRQRFNIGLIVVLGQALQVLLVVAALVAFFIAFGFLAIPPDIVAGWTGNEQLDPLLTATLSSREHVLTDELILVSVFLGMFSGMYFNVVLATDATYQAEFADDVRPEIRQALAVRRVYQRLAGGPPSVDETPGRVVPPPEAATS